MSRRRPSFRAYVRRRWRAVGLLVVLLAGSLLVLAVTDRGHDPLWEARGAVVDQVGPSPTGDVVYALLREKGNITGLQARSGEGGALLWESPMNATRALLRAGSEGAVVATDFPLAFLTTYGADGSLRGQTALEGNPRAMAVEGSRVALALQARGNPVLVFEDARLVRTHSFESFVNALDLKDGRLAVATGDGAVSLYEENGSSSLHVSLPLNVKSLRLSADGAFLVVGGYSLEPGDLSGSLAFLDTARPESPVRWSRVTTTGVGLVDLDDGGVLVLAVEESPPRHVLRAFDGSSGTERWSRAVDGQVSRDDAGAYGGADLSPDGRHVVVATVRGPIDALVATTGEREWRYASSGTTVVAFAAARPELIAANAALAPNGPDDAVLLFTLGGEPPVGRLGAMAALVVAVAAVSGSAILGVGYWRVRRSY